MRSKDWKNIAIIVSITTVLAALCIQFYFIHKGEDRTKRAHSIERAKAMFLSQLPDSNAHIDSIYSRGDTVSYFSNDSLLGTTITTTE